MKASYIQVSVRNNTILTIVLFRWSLLLPPLFLDISSVSVSKKVKCSVLLLRIAKSHTLPPGDSIAQGDLTIEIKH